MLSMAYQSWSATRDWRVEPHGLVLKAGNWYLVARGHGKLRIFNVADILSLDILADSSSPLADFDLANWWAESTREFEKRLRPGTAILRASPIGLQRLRLLGSFAGEAVAKAAPPDGDGWREVALPLETISSAAPMLLGIGPEIDIVEPAELRAAVAGLAAEVLDRLAKANI
jgi:predicted DNA-binding transcriptional regulator YafY